jgi:hypothetical protein
MVGILQVMACLAGAPALVTWGRTTPVTTVTAARGGR